MRESNPKSVWDRVLRLLEGWLDADSDEGEIDDAALAFNLVFIVPILLVFALLLRR
jgi:hypothetical protein